MSTYRSQLMTTGCALFAIFFGSGNLVFPLVVGTTSGGYALYSTLGLILTAVCMPLLGCLGIMLYGGSTREFFSFMGDRGFKIFSLLALALMGPFGVLARCLTVAHGTFVTAGLELSLTSFSLLSCLLLWGAALYRERILQLIGGWLTPLLLVALLAVAVAGFWGSSSSSAVSTVTTSWQGAFLLGAHQGYQTMDLLAAFFFSGFIISQLYRKMESQQIQHPPLPLFMGATAIAGTLLGAIYAMLVYLGAHYQLLLQDVHPVNMLATIATHTMGSWSGAVICVTFALACYTTALVLTVLFADFLRNELLGGAIPQWLALLLTLTIAFGTSTLEFEGIAGFIAPLLEAIYPVLIVVTCWKVVSVPKPVLKWS